MISGPHDMPRGRRGPHENVLRLFSARAWSIDKDRHSETQSARAREDHRSILEGALPVDSVQRAGLRLLQIIPRRVLRARQHTRLTAPPTIFRDFASRSHSDDRPTLPRLRKLSCLSSSMKSGCRGRSLAFTVSTCGYTQSPCFQNAREVVVRVGCRESLRHTRSFLRSPAAAPEVERRFPATSHMHHTRHRRTASANCNRRGLKPLRPPPPPPPHESLSCTPGCDDDLAPGFHACIRSFQHKTKEGTPRAGSSSEPPAGDADHEDDRDGWVSNPRPLRELACCRGHAILDKLEG